MELLAAVGWLDWTLLAILLLSVVVGVWRGFVFEAMALAGWVVAWLGAQWFAPQAAPHVPVGVPGGALNHAAAFAACFVAALLAWAVLARLARLLVQATPLSAVDRVLGAGFGLLRGAVLLLALASVVLMTPARESTSWRDSRGALVLDAAILTLKPLLPTAARQWLPD
jgi:membrane protein required for colicin V production